jgi:hypothetical protein
MNENGVALERDMGNEIKRHTKKNVRKGLESINCQIFIVRDGSDPFQTTNPIRAQTKNVVITLVQFTFHDIVIFFK